MARDHGKTQIKYNPKNQERVIDCAEYRSTPAKKWLVYQNRIDPGSDCPVHVIRQPRSKKRYDWNDNQQSAKIPFIRLNRVQNRLMGLGNSGIDVRATLLLHCLEMALVSELENDHVITSDSFAIH